MRDADLWFRLRSKLSFSNAFLLNVRLADHAVKSFQRLGRDIMKYIVLITLALGLFGSAVAGQTGYSESAEYRPRPVATPTPKKENKKKPPVSDKISTSVPPPTDKMEISPVSGDITVTIPVSVLDRTGAAVAGVQKEEVSVFVDGAEVPIASFEQNHEPVTMVLVVDSSPSTAFTSKTMQKEAEKLLSSLPADMKVMVVDFNSQLNVRSQPTTHRPDTLKALKKVEVGEGTSIYSAIHLMYEKVLEDVPGKKVVVLMTDGVDTTSQKSDFARSLVEVEKDAVSIYPVYFDTFNEAMQQRGRPANDWLDVILGPQRRGMLINQGTAGATRAEYTTGLLYLHDLAAASGGRMFSSEKLSDGTKSLLDELANRYYLTISVPRKNIGRRSVRVRVKRPGLAIFTRGSFID
jgi:VWFA-related protein